MVRTGWFKSSRSGSGNENCVEVRIADGVGVRDSKNACGPVLSFGTQGWAAFLETVRAADSE